MTDRMLYGHWLSRGNLHFKIAAVVLMTVLVVVITFCLLSFHGTFQKSFRVEVVADRAGLVMDPGAKVRLHGQEIGRVSAVTEADDRARLVLDVDPGVVTGIPRNATAQIKSTTVFGAKYVQIDVPADASADSVTEGQQIESTNVTTEVNTLFENLNSVVGMVEPAKLNEILHGAANGLQGRGDDLGYLLTEGNRYLEQINPQLPVLRADLVRTAAAARGWSAAVPDLMTALDNLNKTAATLNSRERELNSLLLALVGMGDTGHRVTSANAKQLVSAARLLRPTSALLEKYNPEYSCLLNAAVYAHDSMAKYMGGTNGYSLDFDVALLPGDDDYKYPRNLPRVATKGGPGGRPGCYPAITREMYPAPVLVMNNGSEDAVAGHTRPAPGNPSFVSYLFGSAAGPRR